MNLPELIAVVAGLCALVLTVGAVVCRPCSLPQWSSLIGMLALGLESLCQAFSLDASSVERMLFWQRLSLLCLSVAPGAWLVFSLTFARGNASMYLKRWLYIVLAVGVTPVMLSVWQWHNLVPTAIWTPRFGQWVFTSSLAGDAFQSTVLVGAVLILMNLEWTFRGAVGTARWKIKYAVIGIGLLFGARIYTSSEVILYSAGNVRLAVFNSLALTLSCLMLAFSLFRSKLATVDIYPSSTALHKSLSVLLAGAYLIVIGLLAKTLELREDSMAFPVKALFILSAVVGLVVLSLSDRVRQATKRFVCRHFGRPLFDYRAVWTSFTQKTAAQLHRPEFARAAAKLLSETFEVLSATIWLVDSVQGRLVLASSTSLEDGSVIVDPGARDLLRELSPLAGKVAEPVDIDRGHEEWCRLLRHGNPAHFPKGGHRFCMPLVSSGELEGLIVVGDRVGGVPFSPEELELLQCLGDQIAARLRNLNLSEKLIQAKELEAFQAMSAFLIHDLKNTASALGLTLRNMPQHFDNPAFRNDALRTLEKSVNRVNALITRLSSLRQKLEINKTSSDLNKVVGVALQSLGEGPLGAVTQKLQPVQRFFMDAGKIESVIVNLLLNAREACANGSEVLVETGLHDGWAFFAVTDQGCGMSPDFIGNSLFKPFSTSKKNGLGIGLFQSKAIVQAHGGRINVQSEPGKGTTFQVWLPMPGAPNGDNNA